MDKTIKDLNRFHEEIKKWFKKPLKPRSHGEINKEIKKINKKPVDK